MQILVLSTGLFDRRYGQQRYELNFLNACFNEDTSFGFRIVLLNDYRLPRHWHSQNARLKFILCGKKVRFFSKVKLVLFSLWFAIREKPSFIICGHINLSLLSFILSRILRIRYIVLTHGTDVWNINSRLKIKALERAFKIITVSRYTASRLKGQISESMQKIIVLPNSVDTAVFAPGERSEQLVNEYGLDGYKVILTVARLDCADRDKGYDKVFAALTRVLKVIPKVKYLLVGEGSDIPRIKKLIRRLNISENIVLSGYVSDKGLASYYNLCDCYVMPSKQEGFGIVFLEAVACGKPVIAGNQDGSKDALLDGQLGILVDPDNIDEITKTIINVLKGNASADILNSDYLRRKTLENFSLDKFKEKASELFRDLIYQ